MPTNDLKEQIVAELIPRKRASELARGHEPANGWGTRTTINDVWADGFRTACVEISDALACFEFQSLPAPAPKAVER
jgi:hypothetical protein